MTRTTLARQLATCLAVLGLTALAGSARAEPAESVTEARERLVRAAKAADEDVERRLAEEAMPALLEATQVDEPTCPDLIVLTEAQLRAGRPQQAQETIARAGRAGCAPADLALLEAWSLEFSPDGTRRGTGAPLASAKLAYLDAAELFAGENPRRSTLYASALANAASLSQALGDCDEAFDLALRSLKAAPDAGDPRALGLLMLQCGAGDHGEGHVLDQLQPLLETADLRDLTQDRIKLLETVANTGSASPQELASFAFYALLNGQEPQVRIAGRYLEQALDEDPSLPDGWYLLGRVHEALSRFPEAKQAYLEQVEHHSQTTASQLAANAHGHLVSELPTNDAEVERALRMLDREFAARRFVPEMLDTKANLLVRLGRRDEACSVAQRALVVARDPSMQATISSFMSRNGCREPTLIRP